MASVYFCLMRERGEEKRKPAFIAIDISLFHHVCHSSLSLSSSSSNGQKLLTASDLRFLDPIRSYIHLFVSHFDSMFVLELFASF